MGVQIPFYLSILYNLLVCTSSLYNIIYTNIDFLKITYQIYYYVNIFIKMQTLSNQINYLIKNQDIIKLKQKWGHKQYDVVEFTDALLQIIDIPEYQNTQSTIGIVQIFKTITYSKKINKIKFSDFNEYLIHMTSQATNIGIYEKQIPLYVKQEARKFAEPPIIIGKKNYENKRIKDYLICHDTKNHHKKIVKKLQISQSRNRLFCLFERSYDIIIYDSELKQIQKIVSQNQKNIIVTIKWCQIQKTLAAMFHNSISFWAEKQKFRFQYKISIKHPIVYLDYVEYANIWIAITKNTGKFLYIDINKRQPIDQYSNPKFEKEFTKKKEEIFDQLNKSKFQQQNKKNKVLRCLEIKFGALYAIALGSTIFFFNFKTKLLTSTLENFDYQIRSIAYSDEYQLLFLATFDRVIFIYELNPKYCDFQPKQSKITSRYIFCNVIYQPKSPSLITLDESNHLKFWNIIDMICYQTVLIAPQFIITSILCIQDKLIIGGSRVAYYEFMLTQTKLKHYISALTLSNDQIYVAFYNSIKCLNIANGKTEKIFDGIFENEQEISKIIINQIDKILLVLGGSGNVKSLNIMTGEVISKIDNLKNINNIIFQQNRNNYYIENMNRLLISTIKENSFKVSKMIQKIKIRFMRYNYFGCVIGIVVQDLFYVIEEDSFVISHIIKIEHEQNILGFEFMEGTESILFMFYHQIMILKLGKYSSLEQRQMLKINLDTDEYITCYKFQKSINDRSKILENINIYFGTNKGMLYKYYFKGLSFNIIKSKRKDQFMADSQIISTKLVTHSFDMLKSYFMFNIFSSSSLAFQDLYYEVKKIKTKLKFIKNMDIRFNNNLSLLVLYNVSMILIFDNTFQQLGEININQTYPIYWNISGKIKVQKQQNYANKILNYLGKTQSHSTKPNFKNYIINDLFRDHRQPQQNTFKKSKLYDRNKGNSSVQDRLSKLLRNKDSRLEKIRQLKRNIIKQEQEDDDEHFSFGIDQEYIRHLSNYKFDMNTLNTSQLKTDRSKRLKSQKSILKSNIDKLKTQNYEEASVTTNRQLKKVQSDFTPIKLSRSQQKYSNSKFKKIKQSQISEQLTKNVNNSKKRYISCGGKVVSQSKVYLPKIFFSKLDQKEL